MVLKTEFIFDQTNFCTYFMMAKFDNSKLNIPDIAQTGICNHHLRQWLNALSFEVPCKDMADVDSKVVGFS